MTDFKLIFHNREDMPKRGIFMLDATPKRGRYVARIPRADSSINWMSESKIVTATVLPTYNTLLRFASFITGTPYSFDRYHKNWWYSSLKRAERYDKLLYIVPVPTAKRRYDVGDHIPDWTSAIQAENFISFVENMYEREIKIQTGRRKR